MKRLLLLVFLIIPASVSHAFATTFTLNPSTLWLDTGIAVGATTTVTFAGPVAAWSYAGGVPAFGSGGSFLASAPGDEWIANMQHGQMIGFIGNSALNLNQDPRVIAQNDAGLFVIGGSSTAGVVGPTITETGRSGELWLGFNDDFATNATSDNTGTGSVDVSVPSSPVPEPSTLLLVGPSLAGLAPFARRRRKS